MTDRDKRIIRNAALAILGTIAVSTLGGCVGYGYGDGGYRGGAYQGAEYHGGGYDGGGYRGGGYRSFGDHDQGR
jgi:hypothetical protein